MERRLDECADRVGAPAHLRKLNSTLLSRGRPRARPVIEQSRASIPQARLLGNLPGDEGPLAVARHVSSVTPPPSWSPCGCPVACRWVLFQTRARECWLQSLQPAGTKFGHGLCDHTRNIASLLLHGFVPIQGVVTGRIRLSIPDTSAFAIVEARSVQEGTPQLCTPAHRSPGCRGRKLTLKYVACFRAHIAPVLSGRNCS